MNQEQGALTGRFAGLFPGRKAVAEPEEDEAESKWKISARTRRRLECLKLAQDFASIYLGVSRVATTHAPPSLLRPHHCAIAIGGRWWKRFACDFTSFSVLLTELHEAFVSTFFNLVLNLVTSDDPYLVKVGEYNVAMARQDHGRDSLIKIIFE